MSEHQAEGVKHEPLRLPASMRTVAEDWITFGGKVDSYLVRPAGEGSRQYERACFRRAGGTMAGLICFPRLEHLSVFSMIRLPIGARALIGSHPAPGVPIAGMVLSSFKG